MASMNFGNLRLDPAKNPAVLDTATWNPQAAWDFVRTLDDRYWQALQDWAAGRGAHVHVGLAWYLAGYGRT